MPCDHPVSALRPENAEQAGNSVTIRFSCIACLSPITKSFLLSSPEPMPHVEQEIADLLEMADAPDMPAAKVQGDKPHPWRQFSPAGFSG